MIIRGRDLAYQFERMTLFTRILRGYPYTRPLLHVEAARDIPGPLRGRIWAALLEVQADAQAQYDVSVSISGSIQLTFAPLALLSPGREGDREGSRLVSKGTSNQHGGNEPSRPLSICTA